MPINIKLEQRIPEGKEFSLLRTIKFIMSYQDEVLKETKKLQEKIKKEDK